MKQFKWYTYSLKAVETQQRFRVKPTYRRSANACKAKSSFGDTIRYPVKQVPPPPRPSLQASGKAADAYTWCRPYAYGTLAVLGGVRLMGEVPL